MSTPTAPTPQAPGNEFARRHIGTLGAPAEHMLSVIGAESVEDLLARAVPSTILEAPGSFSLPAPLSEAETLAELRAIAARNPERTSLIGQGYYGTHTPSVVQRNVLENPSWYTAYTPYQPEISQGRLEALLNFQTVVADLTGTETANASMLDEATAAAEGMLLAKRASKAKTERFLVDRDLFRQTRAVVDGRAAALGIELVEIDAADAESIGAACAEGAFGLLIQYPAASGRIIDPQPAIEAVHAVGGLAVVAADLLALTLLTPPGELGADVVVGTTQRFGVPMGFGGPHAGYMGVRAKLERQLPGRLIGVSKDATGAPAYRLALQTREQHIRRDKATSNICTAQVLLAVMAAMYAVYHGPEGLREIAWRVHQRAIELATRLEDAGIELTDGPVFDTLEMQVPGRAVEIARSARTAGFLLWVEDEDLLRISVDETTTGDQVRAIAEELVASATAAPGDTHASGLHGGGADRTSASTADADLPEPLRRTSEYLTNPVFHAYRSETSMMRYLKRLADKDYALDRGMIPLGSCTMKLNSATEMAAITWPGFASPHPFAPREDLDGYRILIRSLEELLVEITGYDTVSLQPNAGSQGEYAGLLAIRGYHDSRGDTNRRICLVPSSAHGTNAASAALAGLRVVVVASDRFGNVDLEDLKQKIKDHGDELAALMITYPSTHGVYEAEVRTICSLVHDAGGQVYIDGANLNALVEVARPGDFGGDVSHLNLHKTFCIPHGGGGPGVGPVAAKAHLAPFLPGHPLAQNDEHALAGGGTVAHGGAPVSAAPYGSPSILPISWAYVRMMGSEGLRAATASAVLAANYVAKRLEGAFDVLYRGETGLVAHEAILDLRPLTAETGITVDDVAKRLVDYGFHAPTMSFPVAGTLMVEPTESEDLAEIDRFCDAMLAIRAEADRVGAGEWPADDNPLVGAPHTAVSIAVEDWTHPYSREVAVYPAALAAKQAGEEAAGTAGAAGAGSAAGGAAYHLPVAERIASKYWAPVSRVDNAYGDRNLVCSCLPPEAYENL